MITGHVDTVSQFLVSHLGEEDAAWIAFVRSTCRSRVYALNVPGPGRSTYLLPPAVPAGRLGLAANGRGARSLDRGSRRVLYSVLQNCVEQRNGSATALCNKRQKETGNAWGSEGVFAAAIQKFTRTPLKESPQKFELTDFRIAPE